VYVSSVFVLLPKGVSVIFVAWLFGWEMKHSGGNIGLFGENMGLFNKNFGIFCEDSGQFHGNDTWWQAP